MQKVRVVGLRKHLDATLERLQSEGFIELRELSDKGLNSCEKSGVHERLSRELIRLRGIQAALVDQGPVKPMKNLSLSELLTESEKIQVDVELETIEAKTEDNKKHMEDLETLKHTLKQLIRFNVDDDILSSENYGLFLGVLRWDKLYTLDKSLREVSDRFVIESYKLNKLKGLFLVVCDSNFNQQFEYELARVGFSRHMLDKVEGDPIKQLKEVEVEVNSLKTENTQLLEERKTISAEHWRGVVCLTEMLEAAYMREDVKEFMCSTEHVFVFDGWVVQEDSGKLEEILTETTKGSAILIPLDSRETPPTVLNNSPALKPFETMVTFIDTPKPGEKDPTIIFAFAFLVMYGMMLGDAGYGVLSLLLSYVIYKKTSGLLNDLARVWMYASIPTIFFGVLYDEFFGFSHAIVTGHHLYHPWIHRMEEVSKLMVLTLIVGAVHLIIGFFMGFINLRKHHMSHAIAKLLWIVLILGGGGLALSLTNEAYAFMKTPSIAAAVISFLGIVKIEGLMGLFEIPSVVGNVLSYARIMAVGMASVVVAVIINETFPPSLDAGFLVVLPIMLLLHFFNTVLGIFESSIQSARLNYAECFSKFFEGGGKRFNPFRFIRVNTYKS